MDPRWISKLVLLAAHDAQLAEHGGAGGLRDEGALEAALDRPRNLHAYGTPDLADLAAAYAFGIARSHPFIDGNKRASLVAAELFLSLNNFELALADGEIVALWLSLAAGTLPETELAARLRGAMVPLA